MAVLGWVAYNYLHRTVCSRHVTVFVPQRHQLEGAEFLGELRRGQPDGPGILLLSDGAVMAGTWHEGQREGVFRQIDNERHVSYARWHRDQLAEVITPVSEPGVHYGVDLSHYQPEAWASMMICVRPDGRLAKDDDVRAWRPVEYVLLKATEGRDVVDPRFDYHSEMAELLRIPQGAYHVYSSHSAPKAQADNYLNALRDVPLDFPAILDIEGSSREIPADVFREQEPAYVEWLQYVTRRTGRRPVIYCCYDFWQHYGRDTRLADYDFWVARYRGKFPPECKFRQVSDRGRLAGWVSDVDVDVIIASPASGE